MMVKIKTIAFLLFALLFNTLHAAQAESKPPADSDVDTLTKPLYNPFIERYVLDELKQLRQDQQAMRADLVEKVASSRLDVSDRAIRYTADTTTTIFYIITAAASLLVLIGWRSISDIKSSVELTTSKKVAELTLEYENRLIKLENSLKERSDQIVAAQQEISDSNLVHSLWMRAALAKSHQEKIKIYDQILEINHNDVEALTYKADVLLDLDEDSWALSLTDQALEREADYALAYWQRACARTKLGQYHEAVDDIKCAVELSGSLREELVNESYFDALHKFADFQALLAELDPSA